MGYYYSIGLKIKADFSVNGLRPLLNRAEDVGCVFYEGVEEPLPETSRKIKARDAVQMALKTVAGRLNRVFVGYEDTYFFLIFTQVEDELYVCLPASIYPWTKIFIDGDGYEEEDVDTGRYLSLLLDICQDYQIVNACVDCD